MELMIEKSETENVCFSELSIKMILSMIYYAVPIKDRGEFLKYENVDAPFDWLSKFSNKFQKFDEKTQNKTNNVEFSFANKFYIGDGFNIKKCYLESLNDIGINCDNIETLDFSKSGEIAKINQYVSERTHNRINDLIPDGAINESTRSVIINAIYIKALFKHPFNKELTDKQNFTSFGLSVDKVDTMHVTASLQYIKNDFYTLVELPYSIEGLSLFIIQPHKLHNLNANWIDTFDLNAKFGKVHLSLPKFNATSKIALKSLLIKLGIKKIFSHSANLTLLSDEALFVSRIYHMANIEVDETGTTAAAGTGAIINLKMGTPTKVIDIKIDSSFYAFLFYKVDGIGNILFNSFIQNPNF
ncbi:hypothetical protein A3Q56_05124 [Intoshia linei]|uniref:Serpin domain-containing protein n=1 Tax=Intoshia linei TaxID=1819745 RepID=A0A177B089_9BILA|nr:hypothetical protein A3Q56_05124 [Intoshia linei]